MSILEVSCKMYHSTAICLILLSNEFNYSVSSLMSRLSNKESPLFKISGSCPSCPSCQMLNILCLTSNCAVKNFSLMSLFQSTVCCQLSQSAYKSLSNVPVCCQMFVVKCLSFLFIKFKS